MEELQRLDWDSDFFGYEVGKIDVSNINEFNKEKFIQDSKKYRLVYLFSQSQFTTDFFNLVDKKVILEQDIEDIELSKSDMIESFNQTKHDYIQLKNLALESGIYSRFFIDENFKNDEYRKLYEKWIENSVDKKLSFDIIVALKDNTIIGFTTLNKKDENLADIGLVAVSNNFRGLGLGKKLINESIRRAKLAGFTKIQVVTQLDNTAAVNLYQSTKFKIKEVTNIYHYWNL